MGRFLDLDELCGELQIKQCPLGPEFKLNGHFRDVGIDGRHDNYFSGRCGENFFANRMYVQDRYSADSIIEFAKCCKELYTALDGEFPDLSATKLELLSLTTCNRRIPLDYLPESLKTIELSLFSYTKKNGSFPDTSR